MPENDQKNNRRRIAEMALQAIDDFKSASGFINESSLSKIFPGLAVQMQQQGHKVTRETLHALLQEGPDAIAQWHKRLTASPPIVLDYDTIVAAFPKPEDSRVAPLTENALKSAAFIEALHKAVENKSVEEIDHVFATLYNPSLRSTRDGNILSPFAMAPIVDRALKNNDLPVLKCLQKYGVDLFTETICDCSPPVFQYIFDSLSDKTKSLFGVGSLMLHNKYPENIQYCVDNGLGPRVVDSALTYGKEDIYMRYLSDFMPDSDEIVEHYRRAAENHFLKALEYFDAHGMTNKARNLCGDAEVWCSGIDVAKYLLDKGVTLSATRKWQKFLLNKLITDDDVEGLKFCLEQNLLKHAETDICTEAARQGKGHILRFFTENPVSGRVPDFSNAYQQSLENGNVDLMHYMDDRGHLLMGGAELLDSALQNRQWEAARYLRDKGIDLSASDIQGGDLQGLLVEMGDVEFIVDAAKHNRIVPQSTLWLAVREGKNDLFHALDQRISSDIDIDGWNEIYDLAAENRNFEILEALEGRADERCRQSVMDQGITDDDPTCAEYLRQKGYDFKQENYRAFSEAYSRKSYAMLNYLAKHGITPHSIAQHNIPVYEDDAGRREVFDEQKAIKLTAAMNNFNLWPKYMSMPAPLGIEGRSAATLRPATYHAVRDILAREMEIDHKADPGIQAALNTYAYNTALLFRTQDNVMRYLKDWGHASKQPLHDIVQHIRVPDAVIPFAPPNLNAWCGAVLKYGPKMAELVVHSDRIPQPLSSFEQTLRQASKFHYQRATENPELANLCQYYKEPESGFNKALNIWKKQAALGFPEKNIPDITIEGEDFGMPGAQLIRLPPNDIRGLYLGRFTECCQSIGHAGSECAAHGFQSLDSGFYVVLSPDKEIISQSWAWRGEKNELVLDSLESAKTLETHSYSVSEDQWETIIDHFKKRLEQDNPLNVSALNIGTGGQTPKGIFTKFCSNVAIPRDYSGYRDSHNQYEIWQAKSALAPSSKAEISFSLA